MRKDVGLCDEVLESFLRGKRDRLLLLLCGRIVVVKVRRRRRAALPRRNGGALTTAQKVCFVLQFGRHELEAFLARFLQLLGLLGQERFIFSCHRIVAASRRSLRSVVGAIFVELLLFLHLDIVVIVEFDSRHFHV